MSARATSLLRPFAGLAALVAAVVLTAVLGTSVASAAGDRAGDVVVVDETGQVMESGGSATPFGLRLPSGAACPGDSADDNYRVEAFLVTDDTDPGSVVYGEMAPEGEGNSGLWDTNTNSFDGGFTSDAPPGGEGLIVGLPQFSFGVLYPDELAAGDYRIGIACSLDDDTTRYWDASFSVVADAADQPAQFRWTAVAVDGASSGAGTSSGLSTAVWIGALVLVLVLLGLLYLWLRIRPTRPSPVKERSS